MKLLKRIIRKILRTFGILLGAEYRQKRDQILIEKFLKNELKKDSSCVDIGAHKGDFIETLKECVDSPKIIAFEPLPKFYNIIKDKYLDVKSYNIALSNYQGESIFNYVVNDPGWSGFKKQSFHEKSFVTEDIKVEVNKLDNVLHDIEKLDFIKIDVEGAEYLVLSGASILIKKFKPKVIFECASAHMKNYDHDPKKIFDLVNNELGLKIYCLTDTNNPLTEKQFLDLMEKSESSKYGKHAHTNFVAK